MHNCETNEGDLSNTHNLLRLVADELLIARVGASASLHPLKNGPRSEETRCVNTREAEEKLPALLAREHTILIEGAVCCVCQFHGLPSIICINGHTVCERCSLKEEVKRMSSCPQCREPALPPTSLPPFVKSLYQEPHQTCPLCTDDTQRSLLDLLDHVLKGNCAAVTGKVVKTDEACLANTREQWKNELLGLLKKPSTPIALAVCNFMQRSIRPLRDELKRCNSKIAKLQSEIDHLKKEKSKRRRCEQ
ncbi:hypothetical protein CYMTET_8257 [Cymbomonas tetramitiformis]|uniref:Uncharacterized protein n=1 Tax=Cymbomonas tetramitiformis TaxID=36881 RepID=A0AAE0LG18_9CHLO|nr:hypothetical protein CYMTET_8257 [Cymbomonas tetramitiformis]